MRVLRVIPSMDPRQGGPCQGIRNSIPELEELGVDNDVICLDEPEASFLRDDPFTIFAIGKAKSKWKYNKKLIPWLLSNFKNYDVVIIHGLWSYHSYAVHKASINFRRLNAQSPKIFVMPHGMLDPYFQLAKDRKFKALRNRVYWNMIERNVIEHSDGVLFTCKEELLLARNTFPNYKPKQELNVGYGIKAPPVFDIEMSKAFTAKLPNWNGKPFLLFLSRIHVKKGVDLLINAYLQLEKEYSELPQLVIAGPGLDQTFGTKMQKMASNSSNILFPGMLSGKAKWGAFYNCEAFILPSHQENFGIAVVEALACSKAVLVSNKVNIWREILKEHGGLVKNDTAEDTYRLLKKWMNLSEEGKLKMSINAKETYSKYFTINKAASKFMSEITF